MTVVLVPHPRFVDALADLPVRPLLYRLGDPLPDGAADAEVLFPPFLSGATAVALTEELPRLRLVQLLTAGADAWVGQVGEGVVLSDGKGAHSGATAEWVVGALLTVIREFPGFVRAQDRREWTQHVTEELGGKRVLVVGAGDVAEHLVRRLTPFDVATTLVGRRARDGVHAIDEVLDLLPHHDACVLIVPLTDDTRGLAGTAFLAAMPDGAVLVNAARGPVVDTDALVAELTAGRLRAALDVTDPEPLPADHPLWTAPNLFLTPHVGGSVPGALDRAIEVGKGQLAEFLRTGTTPNVVENGY